MTVDKDFAASVMTDLNRDNVRLRKALEESVKLQSHYASILNMYDQGRRTIFKNADEWLARLEQLNHHN